MSNRLLRRGHSASRTVDPVEGLEDRMAALDTVLQWQQAAVEYDGTKAWACFAPGGTYQDHRFAAPLSGDALRKFCDEDMEAMKGVADLDYDYVYTSVIDATHAVAEFAVRGKGMNFRGVEIYEFDPATALLTAIRGYGNFVK